jgi:hypothetical protein
MILALAAACGLAALAQENSITVGGVQYPVEPGAPSPPPVSGGPSAQKTVSRDQLEQMVAPIALYPDSLVAQILIASTYPIQVVQAYQWLQQNPSLAGDQAQQAAASQGWDPSVQSLVQFPQVVQRMYQNIDWTQDLGEAFLAQKADVLNAVQAMRLLAFKAGHLKNTPQQDVTVEENTIVIEPADPQVVYLPEYDPVEAYGDWDVDEWYYPVGVYAPWPGYVAGRPLAFAAGVAVGIAWADGWRPNWTAGNVTVNNNFYRNTVATRYGAAYSGPNAAVGRYGNTAAAYIKNTGEVRTYNSVTGNTRSGEVTQGPVGTRVTGQNGAVGHAGNTTAAYNANTGEWHSYNSATGNFRSGDVDNLSDWTHDASQRGGQSYANDGLNRQYGGGGYNGADRGYEAGGGDRSPELFQGLDGGGNFERSASDRGWSSRSGGGSSGSFSRGGGFSGGGGRRR